jgi:hypothetical protein
MGEDPDAGIGGGHFTQDLLRAVLRFLDAADTLPVSEGLLRHRLHGFPDVRFHIAARHDDGKKRSHIVTNTEDLDTNGCNTINIPWIFKKSKAASGFFRKKPEGTDGIPADFPDNLAQQS